MSSIVLSCAPVAFTPKYDYGYLYDSNQKVISPDFKIFHHSSDSSTLFFEIDSEDILYEKIYGDSIYFAKILMKYSLFSDDNLKNLTDSGTVEFVNYGSNNSATYIQACAKIKIPEGDNYFLRIKFRDENKDLNIANSILIDKRINNNNQYYKLSTNGRVIFNQTISLNSTLTIEKSQIIKPNEFEIEYSSSQFLMNPPPFVEAYKQNINFDIDSSRLISFVNNKVEISNYTKLNRFRFYSDSTSSYNYFYAFDKSYPKITEINEFLEPTRYISTTKEYKSISAAVVPKKAIDAFWLKMGKSEDKAKNMIREYYSRVESANENFTSYKEGWKTDKGIIWIIYGKPTSITKSDVKETWTYGEANNILSVRFDFYRAVNNLSTNDYEMVRNSEYKNNWYRAVDLWRQGKIY